MNQAAVSRGAREGVTARTKVNMLLQKQNISTKKDYYTLILINGLCYDYVPQGFFFLSILSEYIDSDCQH